MTDAEATDMVTRMRQCEQHPHFDSYDATLAEFNGALASYPVTMRIAVIRFERDLGIVSPEPRPANEEVLSKLIGSLDIPTRLVNALSSEGVDTIGQFLKLSKSRVQCLRNVGRVSLDLLRERLADLGIRVPRY